MRKTACAAVLLVLIPILSCGQSDRQPEQANVASVTSYYRPQIGDILTYKVFKNREASIDADYYRHWKIKNITTSQIQVEVSFSDSDDKFVTNWIPEQDFLSNFLRLRAQRITYLVGSSKFRAIRITSDEVESVYAVTGRRSTFPTLLSVTRKGKHLLRLIKVERKRGH